MPGASIPDGVMARMRKAQTDWPDEARAEGVAIARETLLRIKDEVAGVQISPPGGRISLALDVLDVLSPERE